MTRIALDAVMKFVERVKGGKSLRHCPVCRGTGEFDTPSNMGPGVPKCWVCKGVGHVDLDSICTCGMPAILFKDEVLSCGRDICVNAAKRRRNGLAC